MSEDKLQQATNMIREWYYTEIRSMVDGLIADLKSEDLDDADTCREWLTERIDEDTDGHEFVIYTYKAKCLLLASDNEDAYATELGEPAPSVEAAACMAMRADVWELLGAREDEWLPQDCEECCVTLASGLPPDHACDAHDESCSHYTAPVAK